MFFTAVLLIAAGLGGAGYLWSQSPLPLKAALLDLTIPPGASARQIATAVADAGVETPPFLLYWGLRLSGQARAVKAGGYELETGITPQVLLRKLVNGEQALRSVTLVEGWNFRQVRDALRKADHLVPDSANLSDPALMAQIGRVGVLPEGRFFPDTYTYPKGSSDLQVLQRAAKAMDQNLAAAWAARNPQIPLKSPQDALVLASIIEKETGKTSDQPLISAVFNNRLLLGMRLQTDPTVIYGLGAAYDGNLHKIDLETDTPYNTYTRAGLPPGPISMPGKAALLAAVQPAASKALYFVARGDGSSEFSETLDAHNRAVNKYQRGQ